MTDTDTDTVYRLKVDGSDNIARSTDYFEYLSDAVTSAEFMAGTENSDWEFHDEKLRLLYNPPNDTVAWHDITPVDAEEADEIHHDPI